MTTTIPQTAPPTSRHLTPLVVATLNLAAEAWTTEAEACQVCPDWPGLCESCQRLSDQAFEFTELARDLHKGCKS